MYKLTTAILSGVLAISLCGCGVLTPNTPEETGTIGTQETDVLCATGEGTQDGCYTSDDAYDNEYEEPVYPFNTEDYAAVTENGFVSTSSTPHSTFSADVDTASYCNVRRLIESGYSLDILPKGSVRTEEMLNYFTYDYALPDQGEVFGVTSCIADCPWNPDTKLLVMGLQTEPSSYGSQTGNNLVFLIDTSGSMQSSDKLELLQDSFAYLIDHLNPDDIVSIVTYAGSESVVADGIKARDKDTLLRAIYSLEADGSTNGGAGLSCAYGLAQEYYIEGGNNRIVLASDGDLNVGMTSTGDLEDYVAGKRESGIYLSVLGFGSGNYKDTKMEMLADQGNGNYFYIDGIEEAEKVFGSELSATMHTVADDVKLQVEFNPAYVKGYRQIGYENRALATDDFNDDSVDAGEVGSGHSVTVAYELVMVDSPIDMPQATSHYGSTDGQGVENGEWMTLSVHYKNPGEDTSQLREYTLGESDYTTYPTRDWCFATAVIEFGMLANDSPNKGDADIEMLLNTLEAQNDAKLNEAGQPSREDELLTLVREAC